MREGSDGDHCPTRTWPGFRCRPPAAAYPVGPLPSGPPTRPTYREPHPITGGGVASGAGAAAGWLLLFGLLGTDVASYAWWTVIAGLLAWVTALVLVRYGDRGGHRGRHRHGGWLEHRRRRRGGPLGDQW